MAHSGQTGCPSQEDHQRSWVRLPELQERKWERREGGGRMVSRGEMAQPGGGWCVRILHPETPSQLTTLTSSRSHSNSKVLSCLNSLDIAHSSVLKRMDPFFTNSQINFKKEVGLFHLEEQLLQSFRCRAPYNIASSTSITMASKVWIYCLVNLENFTFEFNSTLTLKIASGPSPVVSLLCAQMLLRPWQSQLQGNKI